MLNRKIERVVNVNVTWLGFVFVLISFVCMYGAVVIPYFVGEGGGIRLKLDVQGQAGGKNLDVDRQVGGGSWKLDNFHGCHMCIIPIGIFNNPFNINQSFT